MNESQHELFERQLISISRSLEYPSTPEIAASVMPRLTPNPSPRGRRVGGKGRPRLSLRRLGWSLVVILVLFSSLMLIPPARAAIIEFIQIGVVRIFRAEPTPVSPPQQQFPSTMVPVTATPGPTTQPLIPILERLAGEMTLEEAQQKVSYPILLPSYPPDLGPPDRVFVQDADGPMAILVWIDPQQPEDVLMSLHFLPEGSWAIKKVEPTRIQETTVNGQPAIWAIGPYPIRYSNGTIDFTRLVNGHVLIWAEGTVTYRLETDLSLEEALKVAESLEPIR
jgi:hypothetical protein